MANTNLMRSDGGTRNYPKTNVGINVASDGLMKGAVSGVVNGANNYKGVLGSTRSGGGSGSSSTSNFSGMLNGNLNFANDTYANNMARIGEMYDRVAGNLGSNYESAVGRLQAARNQALKDVKLDAENSLRQAYINNEMTKKNLDQRLGAMGYNGGATESTMSRLATDYANSRGGIKQTLNSNIADLNKTYEDNVAAALQAYNSAMNNLEMQRMSMENAAENAKAQNINSALDLGSFDTSSYLQALQNALSSQGNYQYKASQATNEYTPGNVQQADSAANIANYSKYLEQAKLQAQNGADANTIKNNLFGEVSNGNLSISSLADILRQLGA